MKLAAVSLAIILGGIVVSGDILSAQSDLEIATFAGGCFWCMEADFEKVDGVERVVSGYIGGSGENPTYEDYSRKGYIEAVEIYYDPSRITYAELVELFWHKIDPTDPGGQFCDRGHAYTTAIFYRNKEQKRIAEKSKAALEHSGRLEKPIVTPILEASKFYTAEAYHQDYYKKNPIRYKFYRFRCGRDNRLEALWGNKK